MFLSDAFEGTLSPSVERMFNVGETPRVHLKPSEIQANLIGKHDRTRDF